MKFIRYKTGCRNCLQSDGVSHIYKLVEPDFDHYSDSTEFDVMVEIEEYRVREGLTCDFCESSNVEIHEIEYDNIAFYDFNRIAKRAQENREYIFMINIDKSGSNLQVTPGGSRKVSLDFLHLALAKVVETVEERAHFNMAQVSGNFFICISESLNLQSLQPMIRVERFRSGGLATSEILSQIQRFAANAGIKLNIAVESASTTSLLKGSVFSGALFNSWFYAESIAQADKLGISFSNACFDYEKDILVAYGTSGNESPRSFIDNNKTSKFVVDLSRPPIMFNGKKVYYAKRHP